MAWVVTTQEYKDIQCGEIIVRGYRGPNYPHGHILVTALDDKCAKWLPEFKAFATVDDVQRVGNGQIRPRFRRFILFQRED